MRPVALFQGFGSNVGSWRPVLEPRPLVRALHVHIVNALCGLRPDADRAAMATIVLCRVRRIRVIGHGNLVESVRGAPLMAA